MSERLSIRNPRNGEYDYEIVATTAREIASITSRMRVAQKLWREKGLEYRVSVLEKLKTAVAGRREELVNALSTDTGRLYISVAEVDGIASAIDRWTAVARPKLKSLKTFFILLMVTLAQAPRSLIMWILFVLREV